MTYNITNSNNIIYHNFQNVMADRNKITHQKECFEGIFGSTKTFALEHR